MKYLVASKIIIATGTTLAGYAFLRKPDVFQWLSTGHSADFMDKNPKTIMQARYVNVCGPVADE